MDHNRFRVAVVALGIFSTAAFIAAVGRQGDEFEYAMSRGAMAGEAQTKETAMSEQKFVTGIGGVFFQSRDKESLMAWYQTALGIEHGPYGHQFLWRENNETGAVGSTTWGIFPEDTAYFDPSDKPFMINYRVRDLDTLIAHLKDQGIELVGEVEEYEYGRFAWIMDPDGTKIELWEPIDEGF